MRFDYVNGFGAAILYPEHEARQVAGIAARLALEGYYPASAKAEVTPFGQRCALLYRIKTQHYKRLMRAYHAARRAELGKKPHANYYRGLIGQLKD